METSKYFKQQNIRGYVLTYKFSYIIKDNELYEKNGSESKNEWLTDKVRECALGTYDKGDDVGTWYLTTHFRLITPYKDAEKCLLETLSLVLNKKELKARKPAFIKQLKRNHGT